MTDPACGTCRKKCRKCDRKRPICDRCRTKGLHCEGYPPRFQFQETLTITPIQSSSQHATSDRIDTSPSQPVILSQSPPELSMPSDPIAERVSASLSPEYPVFETSALTLSPPQTSATLSLSPDAVSFTVSPSGHNDLENDIATNQHIIGYCKTLEAPRPRYPLINRYLS
ncbi:hypothetical protein LB503_002168 [Fusarium chuoi]|nr:hypothetical protein LB503_002168 [Fusarium chuoi]